MDVDQTSNKLHKLISDRHHPHVYLKIKLTIDEKDSYEISPVQYKFLITQAIKETLGEVGASTTVDILKLQTDGIALLRVPSRKAEKIWAALTLFSMTPNQKPCAFRVLKASSFLLALAVNTRELK